MVVVVMVVVWCPYGEVKRDLHHPLKKKKKKKKKKTVMVILYGDKLHNLAKKKLQRLPRAFVKNK